MLMRSSVYSTLIHLYSLSHVFILIIRGGRRMFQVGDECRTSSQNAFSQPTCTDEELSGQWMFPEEGSPLSLSYCLSGGSGRSGNLIHPRVVINGRVSHFHLGGHAVSCGGRKSGLHERVGEPRLRQIGLSFTSKEVETNEMKGRYTPALLP